MKNINNDNIIIVGKECYKKFEKYSTMDDIYNPIPMKELYFLFQEKRSSPLTEEDKDELYSLPSDFVKYFKRQLDRSLFCQEAVAHDNLDLLEWGIQNKFPLTLSVYIEAINRPEILEWLLKKYPVKKLARNEQCQLAKLLIETFSNDYQTYLKRFKIPEKVYETFLPFDLAEWREEHGNPANATEIIKIGNLEALRYYHP
jgi:hypothetical protein